MTSIALTPRLIRNSLFRKFINTSKYANPQENTTMPETPTSITGGCLCEALRYKITFPPNHDFAKAVRPQIFPPTVHSWTFGGQKENN